ncbi:hypothetical protein ACFX13_012394 [Malus domestica]
MLSVWSLSRDEGSQAAAGAQQSWVDPSEVSTSSPGREKPKQVDSSSVCVASTWGCKVPFCSIGRRAGSIRRSGTMQLQAVAQLRFSLLRFL